MNFEKRRELEKKIARSAAEDLIAAGYSVSVYDGEEVTLKESTDIKAILKAMFTTDEDHLYAMAQGEDGKSKRVGWVQFTYGNDGWDVISDNTVNLEDALANTTALAEKLADEFS